MYEVFLILPIRWRRENILSTLYLSRIATLPMPPFPGLVLAKGGEEISLELVSYDEDEQEIAATAYILDLTSTSVEDFASHVNELLGLGWEVWIDSDPKSHPSFNKEQAPCAEC